MSFIENNTIYFYIYNDVFTHIYVGKKRKSEERKSVSLPQYCKKILLTKMLQQ